MLGGPGHSGCPNSSARPGQAGLHRHQGTRTRMRRAHRSRSPCTWPSWLRRGSPRGNIMWVVTEPAVFAPGTRIAARREVAVAGHSASWAPAFGPCWPWPVSPSAPLAASLWPLVWFPDASTCHQHRPPIAPTRWTRTPGCCPPRPARFPPPPPPRRPHPRSPDLRSGRGTLGSIR